MSSAVLEVFCPAKINLYLAITGRRPDGFHNLVSLVAPLRFGDTLNFEPGGTSFRLECDDAEVPMGEDNLILKAARLFVEKTGSSLGGVFRLRKRIPMGAGLGGGSSNATGALKLLNQASGNSFSADQLLPIAAALGSDCPLFLSNQAVVMRGRGEALTAIPEHARSRLTGQRVLVFKPAFGIPTAWAYGEMIRRNCDYVEADDGERMLRDWFNGGLSLSELIYNNMQGVAFSKHLALPVMLDSIRDRFGLKACMSGSGSACFALLPEELDTAEVGDLIRAGWGEKTFITETRLA